MILQADSAQPHGLREIAPAPGREVSHAVPAADAAALSLVFLFVFCVICFAWGAAILSRREKKAAGGESSAGIAREDEPARSRAAWEREPDWWKR